MSVPSPVLTAAGPPQEGPSDGGSDGPVLAQYTTPTDFTIPPVHSVACARGNFLSSVQFSPDGRIAYCLMQSEAVDIWAAAVYFWPETLGGIAFVCVLWWLIVVRRVCKRPQIPGQPHCRKCNYHVGSQAPDSVKPRSRGSRPAPGTRCPECGVDLALRHPVRGRSSLRRLALPTLIAAMVALGYVGMRVARLPREGSASGWFDVWWEWVDDLAEKHRWYSLNRHRKQMYRVWRVDVASGRVLGCLYAHRGYPLDMLISPDGRHLVLCDHPLSLVWISSDRLLWITTASGWVSRVLDGIEHTAGDDSRGQCIIGFGGDAADPWVYYPEPDQARVKSRLMRWRPSTGFREVVLEEPGFRLARSGGSADVLKRRYALLHSAKGTATISAPGGREAYFTHSYPLIIREALSPAAGRQMTIDATAANPASPIVVAPDGSRIFMGVLWNQIIGFDMRTGEPLEPIKPLMRDAPATQLAISADGSRLFISSSASAVLVWDIPQARWIARLMIPVPFGALVISPSPDGRWVAAGYQDPPEEGSHAGLKLFLFDLAPINGRK